MLKILPVVLLLSPLAAQAHETPPPTRSEVPFHLLAGHAYAAAGSAFAGSSRDPVVTVLDPAHRPVTSFTAYFDGGGAEFIARSSATYFLSWDDALGDAWLRPDCGASVPGRPSSPSGSLPLTRSGVLSPCPISVNHPKTSEFTWAGDCDVRRIRLNRAYTYRIAYEGVAPAVIRVYDAAGVEWATSPEDSTLSFTWRPATTDAYYLQVCDAADEFGGSYTVNVGVER